MPTKKLLVWRQLSCLATDMGWVEYMLNAGHCDQGHAVPVHEGGIHLHHAFRVGQGSITDGGVIRVGLNLLNQHFHSIARPSIFFKTGTGLDHTFIGHPPGSNRCPGGVIVTCLLQG